MIHFDNSNISSLSKRYRVQLINSLSGYKSANLIATIDSDGHKNLAIFSSVVHLGSDPALIGFIVRPDTVSRHTLENIEQLKSYTINQVSANFWQAAHQTSARYEKFESEFEQTGLSAIFMASIPVPFVKESHLKYALTLDSIIDIPANNTKMVIGKVTDIFCSGSAIQQDGYIDIQALDTVALSGLDSYYIGTRLSRLGYAKPNKKVTCLPVSGELVSHESTVAL